jgi:5-methylcytosine-specific restriction protein A
MNIHEITTIIGDIDETKPVQKQVFQLIRKGKIDYAHEIYQNSVRSGSWTMNLEELQATRAKRTNTRNKRVYGTPVNKKMRNKVYLEQKCLCAICNKRVAYLDATIDHITPASQGGTSDRNNLQMLCKPCHMKKDAEVSYCPPVYS